MKFLDVLKYSGVSIKTQKWRSLLTTLGVIVGITAIVAMLSLSKGFEVSMTQQLESGFATKTVIVSKSGGGFNNEEVDEDFELYLDDVETIESINHVELVLPIIQKSIELISGDNSTSTTLYGVDFSDYSSIYSTFTAEIGEIPLNGDSTEIVIGYGIYESSEGEIIFSINDTLTITWTERDGMENVEYSEKSELAAVLPEMGSTAMGGGPSDYNVYLPLEFAKEIFDTDEVNQFVVLLDDDSEEIITQVSEDIEEEFNDNVRVTSSLSIANTINDVFGTMSLFLGGIAGISLIVAGIGIMNIMIVSLMERTREIGILKAIGMPNTKIMLVFLFETLFIGLIGSIAGIVLGYIFANLFGGILFSNAGGTGSGSGMSIGTITPVLDITLVLQALLYGIGTAVLFGLYPAWRASRLKPVDALRYI